MGSVNVNIRELIKTTNMYDWAIVSVNGSVYEGMVKLINERGISISSNWGDKFFKWYHVVKITKGTDR